MSETLRARAFQRRQALKLALGALSTPLWLQVGAAAGLVGCGREPGAGQPDIAPESLPESAAYAQDYFEDRDARAIDELGRARLRQVEDESAFDDTLAVLDAASASGDSSQAVVDSLREAVARDFANARIVRVEGWVLSQTEADLCALFAVLRT